MICFAGCEALVVPVVLYIDDAAVLATAGFYGSRLTVAGICNIVITNDTAHALIALLPFGSTG
jgi:hypothetical protein